MAASQGQRRRDVPVAEEQELPKIPFAVAPQPPPIRLQGTARRVRLFVFGNPDTASRLEGRIQHSNVDHDDNISPSATESPDSLSIGSGRLERKLERKGQSSKTSPSLASVDSQDQDASSISLPVSVRCRCKGKCKTTRNNGNDRGCECKTEGAACNENCKCNRKKCENKIGLDRSMVYIS